MANVTVKIGWTILDQSERRTVLLTMFIVSVAAVSSVVMVAATVPFFQILLGTFDYTSHNFNFIFSLLGHSTPVDENSLFVFVTFNAIFWILFSNFLQLVRVWAVNTFAWGLLRSVSSRLLLSLITRPYDYHRKVHSSELATKVLQEVEAAINFFYRPVLELIAAMNVVFMLLIYLFYLDAKLMFITFGSIGMVIYFTAIFIKKKVTLLGKERADGNEERFKLVNDIFVGLKEFKINSAQALMYDRYVTSAEKVSRAVTWINIYSHSLTYLLQGIVLGGIVLVAFSVSLQDPYSGAVISNSTLVNLGVFGLACQRLVPELTKIYQGFTQLRFSEAALRAMFRDFSFNPLKDINMLHTNCVDLPFKNSISLKNITYINDDNGKAIFNNITLNITKGQKIAILGKSGSGKSTLVDVIVGLLKPSSGQIFLDDQIIGDMNQVQWINNIAYVPQDTILFEGTVCENITYEVDLSKVDLVYLDFILTALGLNDPIEPDRSIKLNRKIVENGYSLSGGERQRIGLARALYRKKDVLILDEATSALDAESEKKIIAAIRDHFQGLTIIVVTHRPHVLKICDSVYELKSGILSKLNSLSGFEEAE